MRVERIGDPDDPRLRDFTDLRDVQLRQRREPEEGLFLAEGGETIRRAVSAGYRPRAFLVTEPWLRPERLGDVLAGADAPVLVAEPDLLRRTTGFPFHRGALASFDRRPLPSIDEVVAGASRLVVLEDLTDHTNLGAIFRSAAALGMHAVLLTPRCADPLYRRAVRTSMGSVLVLPWTRLAGGNGPERLRSAGFEVWALTPVEDADPIEELPRPARLALALGSEGPGLSGRWLAESDRRVRVSMRPGADSLNVAAAAAIAFHEVTPAAH
jgi:tRNA G18 (ribose-2'-O)-methylase SpoU